MSNGTVIECLRCGETTERGEVAISPDATGRTVEVTMRNGDTIAMVAAKTGRRIRGWGRIDGEAITLTAQGRPFDILINEAQAVAAGIRPM